MLKSGFQQQRCGRKFGVRLVRGIFLLFWLGLLVWSFFFAEIIGVELALKLEFAEIIVVELALNLL